MPIRTTFKLIPPRKKKKLITQQKKVAIRNS